MVQALINTGVQVGVVLILTAVVWLLFGRKRAGYPRWVGLTGAAPKVLAFCLALGVAGAVVFLQLPGVREVASGGRTVVGDATAGGVTATTLAVLAVTAVFKTAFAEELLFRGLIGKRLIAWLGFPAGNLIQALIFGAVHLLILLSPQATLRTAAMLVGFATVLGWVTGWLNERPGKGSILPGWAMHAAANLTAYLGVALHLL